MLEIAPLKTQYKLVIGPMLSNGESALVQTRFSSGGGTFEPHYFFSQRNFKKLNFEFFWQKLTKILLQKNADKIRDEVGEGKGSLFSPKKTLDPGLTTQWYYPALGL